MTVHRESGLGGPFFEFSALDFHGLRYSKYRPTRNAPLPVGRHGETAERNFRHSYLRPKRPLCQLHGAVGKNKMRKKDTPCEDFQLISKAELCEWLSVSEASIDRWIRSNPRFPQPLQLGPNSIRWFGREVIAYICSLPRIEYDDHAFSPDDTRWG